MSFSTSLTAKRPRRVDFMSGSERMLKAHHKNAVFHKYLEVKKNAYDITCNKRLSKVQQEIYDVYFNEYIPLKQQAKDIQNKLPRINDGQLDDRWTKLASIPGTRRGTRVRLPEIHALSLMSSDLKKSEKDKTKSFLDLLKQTEQENMDNRKANRCFKSAGHVWSDSESDDTQEIDEERLRILKTAISLTSQPAPTPVKRESRRLRKSFLSNLRRQSKIVWENELLSRIGSCNQTLTEEPTSLQNEPSADTAATETFARDEPRWQPSLSKNRILNSDDESDCSEFVFPERGSRIMTPFCLRTSVSPHRRDFPVDSMENDGYTPESSPDIFSVTSDSTSGSVSSSYYGSSGTVSDDESYYG